MQNISFKETTDQFIAHEKHVTRRANENGPTWEHLKAGTRLNGVKQAQGLKKGEKITPLGQIFTLEVTQEPLNDIIKKPLRKIPQVIAIQHPTYLFVPEVVLEGFPALTPAQFVTKFCKMNRCDPETEVTRILFDYI